ncbi:MAG TPA: M48 family metalloprotease [Pyrinomonadaceae bacterium]|nr:M48 family metalloprotease [Pyrinomonadaceae bacterium]
MNQVQFDELVKRLEGYARENPAGYKLRVGLLAALGYGYIFLVLAVLVVMVVFLVTAIKTNFLALKFAWILLVFAWVIVRSLWVTIPAPEGLELRREDAPLLFEMVEEAAARLESPRPRHILLTDDFNAAVVQVPRLGLLGWQVNYLIVGLPLTQALSPEQFRAVVAHELGHLSGNHGRFAGWIYRVRQTWVQLLLRLQQEQRHADIFEIFLKWYAPYFNAYSFVLGRAQEYEADRSAAELAGRDNAAEALISTEVKGRFLEQKFLPDILKETSGQAEPPPTVFAQMTGALRNVIAPADARQYVRQALMVATGTEDTHPALKDRLAALGYLPAGGGNGNSSPPPGLLPGAVETSAAEHFLAGSAEQLTARLGAGWREKVAHAWRERHAFVREAQEKLQELKREAEKRPLTPEEILRYALLINELKGDEVALPLFERALAAQPDDATANYLMGQLLLNREDEAGLPYVEKAMERDPEYVLVGCQAIYFFLTNQGREAEAEAYFERGMQHLEMLERARKERENVAAGDRFLPHDLAPEALAKLRDQLYGFSQVERAYLTRKEVTHLPARPFYVLGVERERKWYELGKALKDSELETRLIKGVDLPGDMQVVVFSKYNRWLAEIFHGTAGAEIYRRAEEERAYPKLGGGA